MIKKILFFTVLLYSSLRVFSQPIINPYLQKYDTCPVWTNEIHWLNVVNINDYHTGSSNWDTALINAMADISMKGGGVVYFPSGNYSFKNDVSLLNGVVLRGDMPMCNNAKSDSFAPPTRLLFPQYIPSFTGNGTDNATAFKTITGSNIQNAGLVNLDINRGRISIGGTSRNILIMGVRQNNVAQPQSDIPTSYSWMNQWQRFSYRHCRNLAVYVEEHASVVNCRINDFTNNKMHPIPNDSYDQIGYIAGGKYNGGRNTPNGVTVWNGTETDTTIITHPDRAVFSYTDHYGIGVSGKQIDPASITKDLDQKIEIIDNWVYVTMRIGINGEGYGLLIKGNVRTDKQGKRVFLHAVGYKLNSNNAATYENRAINFAGNKMRIEDNKLQVFRHAILYTPYGSVDGEGILMQTQDIWGAWIDELSIQRNSVNAYIGLWDLQFDLRNIIIKHNDLHDSGDILFFKMNQNYRIDQVYIDSNVNVTGITLGQKKSASQCVIQGNNLFVRGNEGSGSINYPCQAVVLNNIGFTDGMICPIRFNKKVIVTPYFGQEQVSSTAEVSLLFDENITAGTLGGITITGETAGLVSGVTPSLTGKKLIINHANFSAPNEKYTVFVPANVVKNAAGDSSNTERTWWFKTLAKPYSYNYYPSNLAVNVNVSTHILVEFSQALTVIDLNGVIIVDQSLTVVAGTTAVWNNVTNTLSILHAALSKKNEQYTVLIPPSSLKNAANFTNDTIKWSFTTSPDYTPIDFENDERNEVSVYPNPTSDMVFIDGIAKDARIQLYDLKGLELRVNTSFGCITIVDVSSLTNGLYLLKIYDKKQVRSFKLIINK